MKKCSSYKVDIYIAGEIQDISSACKKFAFENGFCFFVEEGKYIYTGGVELGCKITIINYARFPRKPKDIDDICTAFAKGLLDACYQKSCTVLTPSESIFIQKDGDLYVK